MAYKLSGRRVFARHGASFAPSNTSLSAYVTKNTVNRGLSLVVHIPKGGRRPTPRTRRHSHQTNNASLFLQADSENSLRKIVFCVLTAPILDFIQKIAAPKHSE
jgi:hypothetical protein